MMLEMVVVLLIIKYLRDYPFDDALDESWRPHEPEQTALKDYDGLDYDGH